MIPDIRIEDYNYPLPDDRIAKYPLAERDSSKLLRYENGVVKEYVFREIPELLPSDAVMVFNDTKVVPARLHFVRPTGARIEIFCLQPVTPEEYNLSFQPPSPASGNVSSATQRNGKEMSSISTILKSRTKSKQCQ